MDKNEAARAKLIAELKRTVASDPSGVDGALAREKLKLVSRPRPPVADVVDLLRRKNAIVVHFTYIGKGPGEPLYPADFQHAVDHADDVYLCASTIHPNDQSLGQSVGSVGLILQPRDEFSIAKVARGDGGTSNAQHEYPPIEDMEDSIDNRSKDCGYNQWTFQSCEVKGLFAFVPAQVAAEEDISHIVGLPDQKVMGYATKEFADLFQDFPDLRIFTVDGIDFVEVFPDGRLAKVSHQDIYK